MNTITTAICENRLFAFKNGKIICPEKNNLSVKIYPDQNKQVRVNYFIEGEKRDTTFIYLKDNVDYLERIKREIESFFLLGKIQTWLKSF